MASGRINGACSGKSGYKYNFWIEWSSTPNNETNTSVLTATSYLQRNDGYAGSAYNLNVPASQKIIIADGVKETSRSNGIDTRNSRTVEIATIETLVKHNSEGYATANIYSSFPRVSGSLTGGEVSGTVSLDHIGQIKPQFTSLEITALSQTEISTTFTTDIPISRKWYRINDGEPIEYNGEIITGLTAYTNYNISIIIEKQGSILTTESKPVVVRTLPIYITKITLPATIEIYTGKFTKIEAVIEPSNASIKSLKYDFDNELVSLEYWEGQTRLKGISSGKSALKATATDGSGTSATSELTIYQSVSGLSAPSKMVNIPKGQTVPLSYNVLPNNAYNKEVTVVSNNPAIVNVDGDKIVGAENGSTTVTITTVDGNYSQTINVNVIGNYTWYNYAAYIDLLNVSDIMNIYSNMLTLQTMMLAKGVNVPALPAIQVSNDTPLKDVQSVFNTIETSLDILNNTPYRSEYYIESKVDLNRINGWNRAEIFRWTQILNDIYDKLNRED